MEPWYELEESERIKLYYGKHTIKEFWEWWENKQSSFMEVRIKDWEVIKETAQKLSLPYSPSGVYVHNHVQLKNVIALVRNKTTCWFGVNPRRRNWVKTKAGTFKDFGGKDVNVSEIRFMFIDIDKTSSEKRPATKHELKNADILANLILERLSNEEWNKGYVKICSGNGVQLLIKLDFPLRTPELMFQDDKGEYVFNDDFETLKEVIRKGIGEQVRKFSRKYKDELDVQVDKACFNIGRVGALPQTKNYKYGGFTWRGIIEIEDNPNIGLSDYILSKVDDLKLYKEKNVFQKSRAILPFERLKKGKFMEHTLVKYMMETELPSGMRNNYLWFQLKCIVRDSPGIETNSSDFRDMRSKLEAKLKTNLPSNLPDKKFSFEKDIVNKFCIENMLPPVYELWPNKTLYKDMGINSITWKHLKIFDGDSIKLEQGTGIVEDMKEVKKQMIYGSSDINCKVLLSFTKGCIDKYGEQKTKYFFETIFKDYFTRT